MRSALRLLVMMSLVCAPIFFSAHSARAQTYSVIHNFSGGGDGKTPDTGTLDGAGNFYGTTEAGGSNQPNCGSTGCGTVFKLTQKNGAWVLSTLYNFTGGSDGNAPRAGLTLGPDGSIYGSTVGGGGHGFGTVYKLQPSFTFCRSILCPWNETILHRFTAGSDGADPSGLVIFDHSGNLYGTTRGGGGSPNCTADDGCGVVYELTPAGGSWTESLLYTFAGGADGAYPATGVVLNSAGDFFGTCSGGPSNNGVVYQLSPSGSGWSKSFIYQFTGMSDGYGPVGVSIDSAGNLYGATDFGGAGGGGTVYELSPQNGGWLYSLLYPLTGNPSSYGPVARLTMDAAGNLYGTTLQGGEFGAGSVFKLTPAMGSWAYTSLHDFTGGDDGSNPGSRVVLDAQGDVYGATTSGGAFNYGVAFKISP